MRVVVCVFGYVCVCICVFVYDAAVYPALFPSTRLVQGGVTIYFCTSNFLVGWASQQKKRVDRQQELPDTFLLDQLKFALDIPL